jgi:hypothetical protein
MAITAKTVNHNAREESSDLGLYENDTETIKVS